MRHVLVTGGTSGIGESIATAFADRGDLVVVTGRTEEEVDRSQAAVPKLDARQMDVCNAASVTALVNSLDQIDVLVNCAGVILRDGKEFELPGFEQVVDVNLTGTMRVASACRPRLKESSGCIVNTASMLSFFGSGFAPAYSASKGGIVQLTRSLAIAWAPDVRVNAVAPGWIDTALTRPLVENAARSRQIVERTPMGRWGTTADVAGAVVFLCSDGARFITGVVLPVDGGYSVA
jgi:NAD(P)-dependent dehydrogenase (short-subunit alcohol dehydrogenase family)